MTYMYLLIGFLPIQFWISHTNSHLNAAGEVERDRKNTLGQRHSRVEVPGPLLLRRLLLLNRWWPAASAICSFSSNLLHQFLLLWRHPSGRCSVARAPPPWLLAQAGMTRQGRGGNEQVSRRCSMLAFIYRRTDSFAPTDRKWSKHSRGKEQSTLLEVLRSASPYRPWTAAPNPRESFPLKMPRKRGRFRHTQRSHSHVVAESKERSIGRWRSHVEILASPSVLLPPFLYISNLKI